MAEQTPSDASAPHPAVFLLLNLPFGITTGFIVVAVPFLVTRAGLPVLTAASMVSIAFIPRSLKVLWAPVLDIILTLKIWYLIECAVAGGMLLAQSFMPITARTVPLVTAALFTAEMGASLLSATVGGLMAGDVPAGLRGQAAGWYQLGAKIGRALGGGGGLWLAAHAVQPRSAGIILGIGCASCALGLFFLREPERQLAVDTFSRIDGVFRELWKLITSREGALVAVLSLSPIGVSGAENLWSAMASEWRVGANTIVWVTGFAAVAVASIGCVIAGKWADSSDRRIVYLGTASLLGCVSGTLALAPHVPAVFIAGNLAQKLTTSMCDVALSALVLSVIGRTAGATKFTMFAALGTVPEVYMTAGSGWAHDRWNAETMLIAEAAAAFVFITAGAVLLLKFFPMPEQTVQRNRKRIVSNL
jgi:MFS transporter, PAT family, beta-lactamase induction signal transducer AmpG